MVPNTKDFELKLSELLRNAELQKRRFTDISSGNLHQLVGGYPSTKNEDHAMPTCCNVMRKFQKPNDEILHESPSGQSTTLVIRYHLPRSLYKIAVGNTKICPICKDSNFNNIEPKFMFAVYFNINNKHVMIHKNNIHKLEIHGGIHNYNSGDWKYFVTEDEAKSYAESIHKSKALPRPTYCKTCYNS